MKAITLYRHPACPKCAKIAKLHQLFDWRDRLEVSTATPKTGPLVLGEIVVEDMQSGRVLHGADAFALLCRNIPLYRPFAALLGIPAFRRYIEKEMSGCRQGERRNSAGLNAR